MRVISLTLAVLTIACSFASANAADQYAQRNSHIRQELLERKYILEESIAHGANDADTRFYLADCELALLNYQGAADNYAYAVVMGLSGNQAKRCRDQLEKLGRLGFRPNFDLSPSGSAGAAASQPASRGSGKIQSHHDQLAGQLKDTAQRAVQQKQAYFNRAISDIERRLQEDIRHLPKSYTDGRQTVRADNTAEISELTRVARDRQEKLRYQLQKSLEGIERDMQRKLAGLQYSASSLQAQTQTNSGAVGLVPSGTSMHVRNYINFPDASESDRYAPPTVPVRATPGKWTKKQ